VPPVPSVLLALLRPRLVLKEELSRDQNLVDLAGKVGSPSIRSRSRAPVYGGMAASSSASSTNSRRHLAGSRGSPSLLVLTRTKGNGYAAAGFFMALENTYALVSFLDSRLARSDGPAVNAAGAASY